MARSGSTMLIGSLAQTGRFGYPDEYLYRHGLLDRRIRYGLPRHASTREVANEIRRRECTPNGLASVKVFWDHLRSLRFCLREEDDPLAEAKESQILETLWPQSKYIFWRRRDTLAQAISNAKAYQQDEYLYNEKLPHAPKPLLQFNWLEINHVHQQILKGYEGWQRMFEEAKIEPLELWYEEFLQDKPGHLARIFDFMGLKPLEGEVETPRGLKVQRDHVNRQWHQQYERIRAEIAHHAGHSMVPDALEVRLADMPELRVRENCPIRFEATYHSHEPLDPRGRPDGTGWLAVQFIWNGGEAERTHFNFDGRDWPLPQLAPRETSAFSCLCRTPTEPGRHHLRVRLRCVEEPAAERTLFDGDVWLQPPEPIQKAQAYLGPLERTSYTWYHSETFGDVCVDFFPSVLMVPYGWLYCDGPGHEADSFYFHREDVGWFWTTADSFPWVCDLESHQWFSLEPNQAHVSRKFD